MTIFFRETTSKFYQIDFRKLEIILTIKSTHTYYFLQNVPHLLNLLNYF